MVINLDFETYSEAGYALNPSTCKIGGKGLLEVGAAVYAEHYSTDIITCSYSLNGQIYRWKPGQDLPEPIIQALSNGALIGAFNSSFEFYIWNFVAARKYGWPSIQLNQLTCTMARVRAYGLPGSLAKASKAMGLAGKDTRGSDLIKQLSCPNSPTKKKPWVRMPREGNCETYTAMEEYCDQDVITEQQLGLLVPELSPWEHQVWLADQTVNIRGVQVDKEAIVSALTLVSEFKTEMDRRFKMMTGIDSASKVAQFKEWLSYRGVKTESLDSHAISALLSSPLDVDVRAALEIRKSIGAASVKKLKRIITRLSSDNRLRSEYIYCGAERTGRWSSAGVNEEGESAKGSQLQNLTSKSGWDESRIEKAIEAIKRHDIEGLRAIEPDTNVAVAACLRSFFVAKEGHFLICCDFSAIEAVVLAFLSGCQWRMDVFETHGMIYESSASKISGVDFSEFVRHKQETGEHHPLRKSLGKIAELASGYQGSVGAWKRFGADAHFANDEEILKAVRAWRAESPEVVNFWYGLEEAAKQAICQPGQRFSYLSITYYVDETRNVLVCLLPSGRPIYYHQPRLDENGIYFMANRGKYGWSYDNTYGGKLAENVTQATARDIQAHALVNCERAGYAVVMHTHDELVAEVPDNNPNYTVEGMKAIMENLPSWCSHWPIRVEGWRAKRYRK